MTATDELVLRPQDVLPSPLELPDADVDIAVVAQLNLPGQTEETFGLLKRFTRVTLQEMRDAGARATLVDVSTDEEPDDGRTGSSSWAAAMSTRRSTGATNRSRTSSVVIPGRTNGSCG